MSPGAAPSRRGLLAGGAAAAGTVVLSGCGRAIRRSHPAVPVRRPSAAAARRDTEILVQALALERRTVTAYTAGIPLLGRAETVWAKRFLAEELEHVGQVIKLLHLAGATTPGQAPSFDIGHPHDGAGVVRVLDRLETEQIERWLGWIPRLSAGTMRAAAASILANDAQHVIATRQALGRPALTSAFVAGRPGAA